MADVAHAHRRAVAIGDDDIVVLLGLGRLVVRLDREALPAVLIVPFGALVVALPSTPRTSSSVSPRVCSLAGSTWTRIAGFCSPPMITCATPVICEICCAIDIVGVVVDLVIGSVSECAARIRIGKSAGFTLR